MKIRFLSVLLLLFFSIPGHAAVILETEIISGKVTHIDAVSITLSNNDRFLSTKVHSGKLPFQINQMITLRYFKKADGTLVYVEAASGNNSLKPANTQRPRQNSQFN